MTVKLSVGRQAQIELAVIDAFEARDDPDELRARVAYVVDLHHRLCAEQLAELGVVPDSFSGCVAVLHAAARILEVLADDDLA